MASLNDLTVTLERKGGLDVARLPGLKVRLTSAKGVSQDAVLGLTPVVVGSEGGCTLVIKDAGVSRRHCEISLSPAGPVVRDLGSKNGTFIGGVDRVRLIEAQLMPGAIVSVGGATLTVVADGAGRQIPLSPRPYFGEAVGASVPMRALFAELERAANSEEPIVLLGESGTGKEVLAHAIHQASPRRDETMQVLDCTATPRALIESYLFGHAKGAFTGAAQAHQGLFAKAHGGTLFLDEVGELPIEVQPTLLRVLETRQVFPLGGGDPSDADVRLIAATHRDLRAEVKAGTFREDLFYRLVVVEAMVPALRDHKDDIPLLVERFLQKQQPPKSLADLPAHALELFRAHSWPGNVRELRNTVARLMLFPELGADAIGSAGSSRPVALGSLAGLTLRDAREQLVDGFERAFVAEKLRANGGNVSAAAKAMGVSRQLVHRLMARYDLRGRDG